MPKKGYKQTDEHKAAISAGMAGKRGDKHGSYRGGRTTDNEGRARVLVQPDHPFFEMAFKSGKCSYYIKEHRLVMAEAIGRALTKDEVVHHIDEDVTNNDISNLMLFDTAKDHTAHHWENGKTIPPRGVC